MSTMSDMKKYRKIIARRKMKNNIIILVMAVVVIAAVFCISDFIMKKSNAPSGNYEFPVSMEEQHIYSMQEKDGDILISSGGNVNLYNTKGNKITSYNHGYITPITKVNAGMVLTYSQGTNKFSIKRDGSEDVESYETDYSIIFCEISEYGKIAIATMDNKYKAEVKIYNEKLEPLFSYYLNQYPVGMCFTSREAGVVVTQSVNNGVYKTNLYGLNFTSEKEDFILDVDNTFAILINQKDADNISVVMLDRVMTFDKNGKKLAEYKFYGKIINVDNSYSKYTVLVKENLIDKDEVDIVVLDSDGKVYKEKTLDVNPYEVICDSQGVVVVTNDEIITYNHNLVETKKIEIQEKYDSVIRIGKNLYGVNSRELNTISIK